MRVTTTKPRCISISHKRWNLFASINSLGYFNLGAKLYVRNGGFAFGVSLLFAFVQVMYVAPRSPAWMRKGLEADT